MPMMPLVVYTDSYSLYECLVKLGITNKKRLIVDVLVLRQLYERREIAEIRWISGSNNPADAFTKVSLNRALKRFINAGKMGEIYYGRVQAVRRRGIPRTPRGCNTRLPT